MIRAARYVCQAWLIAMVFGTFVTVATAEEPEQLTAWPQARLVSLFEGNVYAVFPELATQYSTDVERKAFSKTPKYKNHASELKKLQKAAKKTRFVKVFDKYPLHYRLNLDPDEFHIRFHWYPTDPNAYANTGRGPSPLQHFDGVMFQSIPIEEVTVMGTGNQIVEHVFKLPVPSRIGLEIEKVPVTFEIEYQVVGIKKADIWVLRNFESHDLLVAKFAFVRFRAVDGSVLFEERYP